MVYRSYAVTGKSADSVSEQPEEVVEIVPTIIIMPTNTPVEEVPTAEPPTAEPPTEIPTVLATFVTDTPAVVEAQAEISQTEAPALQEVQVEVPQEEEPEEELIPIMVKVSHYNPSAGGINCFNFVNGECISKMSNGERWQDYWEENNTIACPMSLPFGTVIRLDDNDYTCRDRGGKIVVTAEGYYWIDILGFSSPYPYGTVVQAYIVVEK